MNASASESGWRENEFERAPRKTPIGRDKGDQHEQFQLEVTICALQS